jgi:plasmid stabilization system protein ParE
MVAAGRYRVILSRRAFDDLDQILDYIKQTSPSNAVKVIDRLQRAMEGLGDFPHRYRVLQGRARADKAVRVMPVAPHLVYYRVVETPRVVRVLTVRHGSQRQPRRFQ